MDDRLYRKQIVCKWTGHEMPPKVDAILTYVNGNKYKHLVSTSINNDDLRMYAQFLVPTKSKNPAFQ